MRKKDILDLSDIVSDSSCAWHYDQSGFNALGNFCNGLSSFFNDKISKAF